MLFLCCERKLAVYCHCSQCRKYASTAMQLAIWAPADFKAVKGDDNLTIYESAPGVFRKACKTCGCFAYKTAGDDTVIVPIGALEYVLSDVRIFRDVESGLFRLLATTAYHSAY